MTASDGGASATVSSESSSFPGLPSGELEVTEATLVKVPSTPAFTSTAMSKDVLVTPRSPIEHVTVPTGPSTHEESLAAATKVTAAGSVSVTITSAAASGPALVTVIVYTRRSPGESGSISSSTFVSDRSTTGPAGSTAVSDTGVGYSVLDAST